jgi:putative membrane-bound dehydrogenase-like protein
MLAAAEAPLRVFIRAGQKSHAPGAHDYPQFLKDWVPLLKERGIQADGALDFPTKEQLDKTDVLILHSQEAGNIKIGEERKNLLEFLKRGGGLVTLHAGAVSQDADWFKSIIGGSWRQGTTKWLEGPMHLYFTDRENPITMDCSNFAMDDEIYYDMDILPEARILAGAYTPKPAGARNAQAAKRAEEITGGGKKVSIYDIQPQMWTYETTAPEGSTAYRSFVSIPGHLYINFNRPNYRAILLRGIAWAGKRQNADEFCKPEELGDGLRYVEGGPTRPDKAAALIEVHPEFEISLVAAEPLINKAMNVDWDEKGRLWVCETPEYPNGRRVPNTDAWKESGSISKEGYDQREPRDVISILTDTNGDGVMDKKKIFADKLELATSFCFYKKGVIVCAAPDIWYFEDTDGDDVADKRTKLYSGLGNGDTHAVMNNLRWGLDGWVYATHGYSAGDVTSLGAKSPKPPVRIASGVVRFKPDGSEIEMFSSRGGNTWGLDITWDGQVFWTQPTSGTVFFHTVLPEYVLAKGKVPGTNSWKGMITGQKTFPLMSWPEQAYVQIDQVGSFTAAAGCAVYEGGAWPEKWNYSYFTTEATLNIVHQQFVKPDGVSYTVEKEKGREETEFIRSKDLWFRPIENRVGPDGALYLVDFYNQAVIHNDTRGPLHGPANAAVRPDRDHYFGRIWKVQHKQAKKLDVPVLDAKDLKSLTKVIETSPNAKVKQNAWRLIREGENNDVKAKSGSTQKGKIKSDSIDWILASTPNLHRMGSKVLREYEDIQVLDDTVTPADPEVVGNRGIEKYLSAQDDWTRSAMIAALTAHPVAAVADALKHPRAADLSGLVGPLVITAVTGDEVNVVLNGKNVAITPSQNAAQLLSACADAPATSDAIKVVVLRSIGSASDLKVNLTPELAATLKKLISQPALASSTLPLVVKWDQAGTLANDVKSLVSQFSTQLADKAQSVESRINAAKALIGVGGEGRKAVVPVLTASDSPAPLLSAIIEALGNSGDVAALVSTFSSLQGTVRTQAFDQILQRPEATLAFLGSVKDGKITVTDLGPGNVARLRTHPNKAVANQAAALMDTLSPQTKQKNEAIAALTPEVLKPGNVANGKLMFTAACAICHKLGDVGTRDVGPPLTGMGAHGPAELLVHIVDPNREVDPSFWQWNITTTKGETLVGVISSENAASVTLRSQTGDVEIPKANIANRENTRRSLMPEGFEALGPEVMRDLLAFICGGSDAKFRIVDLAKAYTADTRRGLFNKEEATGDTVFLSKFGNVTVDGIPFYIMDPAKSSSGMNVVTLKGGGDKTFAHTFPQKVEAPVGVAAKKLHLLSGIAGWGFPAIKDERPVLKLTMTFADGQTEVHEMKNGVEFADYNREIDVPKSAFAEGVVSRGQLRLISLNIAKASVISKVELESYNNGVTPVIVAITADVEGKAGAKLGSAPRQPAAASAPAPAPAKKPEEEMPAPLPIQWEAGKTKVLIVAGGSSHDFKKWFEEYDSQFLKAAGFSVNFTENSPQATAEIKNADVVISSTNRTFFDTPAWRKALFDHVEAGKGVIMLHPGTWYGFPRWPEVNAKIVGGGSRGHDKIHPYDVNTLKKDHPVMAGVPASFKVEDELYYMNAEAVPEGTAPIEVLAETSPSDKYKKPHPAVWVTQNDKARIVGITIGHDGRTHELPGYQQLLIKAVKWTKK